MSDKKLSISDSRLLYSKDFADTLSIYREGLIASLGIESEKLVVRSDNLISDFNERLRLINFLSSQLSSVSEFISGYIPDSDN